MLCGIGSSCFLCRVFEQVYLSQVNLKMKLNQINHTSGILCLIVTKAIVYIELCVISLNEIN